MLIKLFTGLSLALGLGVVAFGPGQGSVRVGATETETVQGAGARATPRHARGLGRAGAAAEAIIEEVEVAEEAEPQEPRGRPAQGRASLMTRGDARAILAELRQIRAELVRIRSRLERAARRRPAGLPGTGEAPDVVGLGGGAGGKFGGRGGGRVRLLGKGGRRTAEAIGLGLEWLENHQDSDGKWSCAEFMKHCPPGDICDGPGNPINNVGVTGLALLAFLGDGSTLRAGPYKDVVKRAVLWLKDQMDDEGLIGTDAGHSFMYNHAIASLAMVEAYGLSKYRTLWPYAQKCINYIERARNPYKVWRYYPHDGQNDTSVTGWMVCALESAKDFGLEVDADALRYAEAWFEEVTDQNTGRAGYTKKGEPSSRKEGLEERFPPEKTEALTAVGLLCRIFLGQDPKHHPVLRTAAETMLDKKPKWNPADGSIDMYYWYYGSYAMFQMGGRYWNQWRKSLEDALLEPQRRDGHARGSWDPISAWSDDGGRVYTTALGVLTLEVYYRYSRLIR